QRRRTSARGNEIGANASGRNYPLRVPRNATRHTSTERLHRAHDAAAFRGGVSIGVRSNPLAAMTTAVAITCLFVDIGGVLLTDGWDHQARKRASRAFKLNWADMEGRHRLIFDTYEEGKLSLDEY